MPDAQREILIFNLSYPLIHFCMGSHLLLLKLQRSSGRLHTDATLQFGFSGVCKYFSILSEASDGHVIIDRNLIKIKPKSSRNQPPRS